MADIDTLTITFDDQPGTVVTRQKPVDLDEYFSIREAFDAAVWNDRKSIEAAYAAFAPVLISWDLGPPATVEGMAKLDILLAMTIIGTWITEVRNVPRPLARRSSAGEPSPAS